MSKFTFKGKTSTSMGLVVDTYPPIIRAAERIETVTIPGRSGELTLVSGVPAYESYVKEVDCYIAGTADVEAITAWLSGRGDVIFGNEPTYAYEARVVNEVSYDQVLRGRGHRNFVIPFVVQPLKKLVSTEADIVKTTYGPITNPGTAVSRPRLLVQGTGDVSLFIGQYITHITGLNGSIVIDSELGMATNAAGTGNLSHMVSGDWPLLVPGSNAYNRAGAVTQVTITPRWRWL